VDHRRWLLPLCCALLAACAPRERPPEMPGQPADFPGAVYESARHRADTRVYRIDAARSLIEVRVYRAGALAHLGHDHVIAVRDLQGLAALSADGTCRADLYFPVAQLTVDEPALRELARLDTQPGPEDIAATRRNMLGAVLMATEYPFVQMAVHDCNPAAHSLSVSVQLTGQQQLLQVPVSIERLDRDQLQLSGAMQLSQSSFGITPYSALGGLLQVRDELDVHYRLTAIAGG
jgi:hypothetical protein